MPNHWSQIQEAGGLLGIKFMFLLYRWFGRWVFTLVLYPVISYFFATNKAARHASLDYLQRLRNAGYLPNRTSIYRQSFFHFLQFGKTLLDKLAAWTGAFNYDNVRFQNRNEFLQMIDKGKGALIIVSHLGNLEVCRALANESQRLKLNILVHTKHAEKFNKLMNNLDETNKLNLIQVTDFSAATAIILSEKLEQGETVVIAGDRTPVDGGRQLDVEFLGTKAYFPQGPYILASLLKCPTYLMFCAKDSEGYKIFFEHFSDRVKLARKSREADMVHYAQTYAQRLEHYVEKFPFQWNNFYMFWDKTHQ